MSTDYLKQMICIRRDLCMPSGKIGAMAAHAAMTFILKHLHEKVPKTDGFPVEDTNVEVIGRFTKNQWQWMTEIAPGLEDMEQISFPKIVLAVDNLDELEKVEKEAKERGLTTFRVIDSGYSHNKPRTLAAIAIGPHRSEELVPVTGKLKVYR